MDAIDNSAAVAQEPKKSTAVARFQARETRRKWLVAGCQIAFGLSFLAFWQYSSGHLIDPFFVSSPIAVFAKLWDWTISGYLWYNLSMTLFATGLGFAIGAGIGFVLGILFGRYKFVADVFDPYITAIYSLPKIALAPLFIMWFGIGLASKVAVSAAVVFFLVFLNTFSGVREVNPIYIHATQIMGANSWNVMRTVIIPSATAWVITGLKVSVPYALVGTVIGEFMSANRGIGFVIAQASALFDTTSVFTGLLVLAIVGSLINAGLKLAEGWLLRWRP
ncbi:ABC transporter permease [Acuticoccus mangrovi]|uniref:ABC transporter permease n=1 Tax=Acuticoccus mangrovi TaxID=2796142 RepID=A0A934INV1_9HYPH|nr:ABC transporter permease [Acuticoccus mangrovi]MBJ3774849.1 ABC transporter permease [Acuticoccus mangrovi]